MKKKLGFGLMRLPLTDESDWKSIDGRQLDAMVDCFLDHGFNYFDTAYVYHLGTSELAVRKALTGRHRRDEFMLASKMPTFLIHDAAQYSKIFDEQLARTGVDYFDYYLLHNLGEKNYADTLRLGGFPYMEQLKRDGKALHIGFSFHDKAEVLERILSEHPEMEFVQLQINYMDWESDAIESRKCYETALRHGKPVIAMEPVKGGSLVNIAPRAVQLFRDFNPDASVASWAVRYAASLDNVVMVLSGMSSYEQMLDNVSYMQDFKPLTAAERSVIDQVCKLLSGMTPIPCTNCRYCVDGCPQQIAIPEFFALYNDQHQFGYKPGHDSYYLNLTQQSGKASDCIACGQCEEHCPQHIEIPKWMQTIAGLFEKK